MKYLKIYEEYLDDDLDGELYIPKKSISGTFYHGTLIYDEDFFSTLKIGQGDWEALWFSSEMDISEQFASRNLYDGDEDVLEIIFKVILNSDSIADIDYSLYQDLMEYYGKEDFRELIDILKEDGFEGWSIPGSIDNDSYNDIALFVNYGWVDIKSIKFKLSKDEWSEFISIHEAEDFFIKLKKGL